MSRPPTPDAPPKPEEVGKEFRIPNHRPEGAPVGKPDAIENVLRRQVERAPQRQSPPPRRRGR